MKYALLLLSLMASTAAAPKSHENVTWNDIHAFIVAESTNADSWTEAELWAESVDGEKTWTISGGAQARAVRPLDGVGLGWPKENKEITFTNAADAQECGAMIDEFRESQAH